MGGLQESQGPVWSPLEWYGVSLLRTDVDPCGPDFDEAPRTEHFVGALKDLVATALTNAAWWSCFCPGCAAPGGPIFALSAMLRREIHRMHL